MNARRIMAGLAVTALVFGSASLALARGHNGGMMAGYAGNYGAGYHYNTAYQSLTPEKQAAVDKLIQEHVAEVTPLRTQLLAKRLELDALSGNPNVQPEQVSKLAAEVADLSSKLRASGLAFRDKLSAETGIDALPYGGGYGWDGRGGRACGFGGQGRGCDFGGYGCGYGWNGGNGYTGNHWGGHMGWHR